MADNHSQNVTSTCHYAASLCNFGYFLWNCSLLLNVLVFLPQLYKIHRKRRHNSVSNGVSVCWLALAACAQSGYWRWYSYGQGVNASFAIVMSFWLFLSAFGVLLYTMLLSETHFDYQRPLTLGLTLLGCVLILTISCLSRGSATAMRGFGNFLSMLQIYPQLLLSELIRTPRAVSVWTIILFLLKYCQFYIAQYIIFLSTEEFVFTYMTACMFLAALFHCFARPSDGRVHPGSGGLSRSQFTVLPPGPAYSGHQDSQTASGASGIDTFFAIDDFDPVNDIGVAPVNLPTVSVRQDGHRTTFGRLSWYTTSVLIGVIALLLTVGLVWKVRQFVVILAPVCVGLLLASIFAASSLLPERTLTVVKFIL